MSSAGVVISTLRVDYDKTIHNTAGEKMKRWKDEKSRPCLDFSFRNSVVMRELLYI